MTEARFWTAIAIVVLGAVVVSVDLGKWLLRCRRSRLVRIDPHPTKLRLVDPREPPVLTADRESLR